MRRLSLLIVGLIMGLGIAAQTLKVGSYNIRYQNQEDSLKGNGWRSRCQSICNQIWWENPDIFGTQEVLHPQLLDLEHGLGGYRWIGVGRDDGKQKGEYAAIFYNPHRVELIQDGHFWLNETPDRPALGWDAACIRICTWGRFRHLQSGREFYFLNLHMDHVGVKARRESARLVMQRITEMTDGGRRLAVLTGDFNVSQNDELYTLFTQSGVLKDCFACAERRWAENGTYNAFKPAGFTSERIDHIFVTPATRVEAYAVRTDSRWQAAPGGDMRQRVISDHYPIFARISFDACRQAPPATTPDEAWSEGEAVARYNIIPLPSVLQTDTAHAFLLLPGMAIAYDAKNPEAERTARFLQQWVEETAAIRLQLAPDDKRAAIRLSTGLEGEEEAYALTVGKKGIDIRAAQPVGLFRAAQTLRKALPTGRWRQVSLPYVRIQDAPRFAYRGVLLDCGRHFFSVEVIKQFLDVMALHGCNQFHWHLTEDQGWRFEVKALPRLAREGSVREKTVIGPSNMRIYDNVPYGGYYTQDDCREIVRYAAERYINVIPEIDMPGHMMGALHVFPNLGCTGGPYPVAPHWGVMRDVLCGGNPETLEFLKTAFGELCDVFPSKFIHIGGDECPKDRWRKCPKCQQKIRELGLKEEDGRSPEDQLQTYLNHEIEQFLASRGRSLIGWDEILAGGLTENAIVMSWRGTKGGIKAAKQNHRVIMSPNVYAYIDHPQLKDYSRQPRTTDSYQVSCSKMYSFEPVVPEELTEDEQKCILGVQANLWTEQVAYPEHLFYQLLPRLAAMSEVQWCRPEQKDFEDFKARLPRLEKFYDKLGVQYCRQVE